MNGAGLGRRELVAALVAERGEAAIVSGLGAPTYDCYAAGDSPLNFYLWGGMGGATMVGLGLALARPERRIVVVTGDGELLMSTGCLATVASQQPSNLAVVVLDNEAFGETGRQPGLTGMGVDIAAMALAAGFRNALTVRERPEVDSLFRLVYGSPGPVMGVAKVRLTEDPVALPTKDGVQLRDRFMEALAAGEPREVT